jgi:flagellar biogenesis protein FliO
MSLAALARGPLALLPALGGALLMVGVLGLNVRGAAAAVLAAAGALALTIRSRASAPAVPRALQIVERLQLGPRQTLVLVETAGRRYLVATGATVTSLPLEERG